MRVLQLVPNFGKEENALYHYAQILANELLKVGINSYFDVDKLNECEVVFLNYVGYGYDKRGMPVKLLVKLWYWTKYKKKPLFIFFHELYAGGNHWTKSSFWLYPFQKMICHILFDLAKCSFCSNEIMYSLLRKHSSVNRLYNVGLISNIPTSNENLSYEKRKRKAIIFGTFERRKLVFENIQQLNKVCEVLQVESIIDIGKGDVEPFTQSLKTSIEYLGELDKNVIAKLLSDCAYGFICYEDYLLAKSGIFAAYAGNGMVVINFHKMSKPAKDGLFKNKHYYTTNEIFNFSQLNFNAVGESLYSWYQSHNLGKHCSKIVSQIINKE